MKILQASGKETNQFSYNGMKIWVTLNLNEQIRDFSIFNKMNETKCGERFYIQPSYISKFKAIKLFNMQKSGNMDLWKIWNNSLGDLFIQSIIKVDNFRKNWWRELTIWVYNCKSHIKCGFISLMKRKYI